MKSNFRIVREVYLGRSVEASVSTSTLKNEPSCGRPAHTPAPRFANQSNSRRVIRVPPYCVSRHRAVSPRSSVRGDSIRVSPANRPIDRMTRKVVQTPTRRRRYPNRPSACPITSLSCQASSFRGERGYGPQDPRVYNLRSWFRRRQHIVTAGGTSSTVVARERMPLTDPN